MALGWIFFGEDCPINHVITPLIFREIRASRETAETLASATRSWALKSMHVTVQSKVSFSF